MGLGAAPVDAGDGGHRRRQSGAGDGGEGAPIRGRGGSADRGLLRGARGCRRERSLWLKTPAPRVLRRVGGPRRAHSAGWIAIVSQRYPFRSPVMPRIRLLSRLLPITALTAVAALAAACSGSDYRVSGSPDYAATTVPDSALVLGPGDILIHNSDGTVDLALVHDTVWMKLSDSLLNSIQHDMDTSDAGNRSGFGASIAKMVKIG